MSRVAIITMVQAADLPHALASLASARRMRPETGIHLVLLNDPPDNGVAEQLRAASGAEILVAGRNLGVAGGRNRLIREARARGAEFVLSIDDDILAPPDFVSLLGSEFAALAAAGRNPGILTPATLDFHAVAGALYSAEEIATIHAGVFVATPATDKVRTLLARREKRRARDIYHMGIADWRGAYFYAGGAADHAIQHIYQVRPERLSGAEAHLRHAKGAWDFVIDGADPIPIDTAPGGICFYPIALAEKIGFNDESFNPFGFEDADFALRAGKAGFQHFCAPRAIAIHDIAGRLSERPIAVLRATQGKMAGAFVRKHAEGREKAAAFAALTRRAVEQTTLAELAQRENGEALRTPRRLEALLAYLANAIAFVLPPRRDERPEAKTLLQRVEALFAAAIPGGDSLPVRRDVDGFELGGADGGVLAAARVLAVEDGGHRVSMSIARAHVAKRFLPPLAAAAFGGAANFDLDLTLLIGASSAVAERFTIAAAPAGFRAAGSGRFRREMGEGGAATLRVEDFKAVVEDAGGLPRVVRLLAEVERLSPAAYLKQLVGETDSAALRRWLRGETAAIEATFSATIDGAPGPIRVAASFAEPAGAPANPVLAGLWTDEAEPLKTPPPPDESPQRPLERTPMTFRSLVSRLVADDPSVAPYPESYDPPKALRLARRARYYSAARGVPLTPNEAKIVAFRDRHQGERAFIIGNGPSLNNIDLTRLKNEATFGVNAIYLNREKMGFLPTHHIVEDVFVAEDRAAEINALSGPHKWYGHYLRYCLKQTPDVCWLNVACDYRNYPGFPHFSTNAARIVWVGGTVSYIALQLAYHMGFKEVILVGFDHSYSIPKEAKVDGRAITSTSDDPNHFHPDYFGKGYRWHDPRVDRMEKAYVNARRAYEAAGRKVINATAGGHLEVFERRDFDSLFS